MLSCFASAAEEEHWYGQPPCSHIQQDVVLQDVLLSSTTASSWGCMLSYVMLSNFA